MRRISLIVVLVLVASLILPATASAAPARWGCSWPYHSVWPGQTLFSIGRLYGVSAWSIWGANPWVADPNYIQAGWCLYIPTRGIPPYSGPCPYGTSPYTVGPGEWLYSIGRKFGVSSWSIFYSTPWLTNPNYVQAGWTVCIP